MTHIDDQIKQQQEKNLAELKSYDPDKYYPVLLLTSYCDNNDECTDFLPCEECLEMCNIAIVKRENIEKVICGYNFLDKKEYRKNTQKAIKSAE